MALTSPPRLRSRLTRRRSATGLALVTVALTASTLTVTPAVSAPADECPEAYPVADLESGEQVTGLTVTKGTTPTGFTGEVLGVIEGGIGPDFPMIIAELTSDEIDRVGGIWQGMSGSPVYAEDGRLIGAVAYGLAWGPSPVAGITPYGEMERLLTRPAAVAAAEAEQVDIPKSLAKSMAASGTLSLEQSGDGLERLPLPLGVSGLGSNRLPKFRKALGLSGVRVRSAGAVSASSAPLPIEAGGNLAASLSYGDVSAVGVGTATAVCGDEVLAFGHPMMFSGPSQLAMHGASAVYVQKDPVSAPFKVANATAPVGAVLQDRMAGLLGVQDASRIPTTSDITSFVDVAGEWSREGTTRINVPAAVPDLAAFHLLANHDRVFDSISGGSATVGWTVDGTRENGSAFRLTRSDVFANKGDVSYEPVLDLFDQLAQLQFNDVEEIRINAVRTTSALTRRHVAYSIAKVHVREGRRWRVLSTQAPLLARSGETKRFRVILTSPQLGRRVERLAVTIPRRAARKFGYLEFVGGNSFYSDMGEEFSEEGYGGGSADGPSTFDQVLRRMRQAPTNDMVLANLVLFRNNGTSLERSQRSKTGTVVNGNVTVDVVGTR